MVLITIFSWTLLAVEVGGRSPEVMTTGFKELNARGLDTPEEVLTSEREVQRDVIIGVLSVFTSTGNVVRLLIRLPE